MLKIASKGAFSSKLEASKFKKFLFLWCCLGWFNYIMGLFQYIDLKGWKHQNNVFWIIVSAAKEFQVISFNQANSL